MGWLLVIFGRLQQLGVGLAFGILIDATIFVGLLLHQRVNSLLAPMGTGGYRSQLQVGRPKSSSRGTRSEAFSPITYPLSNCCAYLNNLLSDGNRGSEL